MIEGRQRLKNISKVVITASGGTLRDGSKELSLWVF
ncbi:hypothetical protein HEBU111660_06640 [Helicobacter burdigaliensis]